MAYWIDDNCTDCGDCAATCPTGAIIEGDGKHEITDECISCGVCLTVCPVGAIHED